MSQGYRHHVVAVLVLLALVIVVTGLATWPRTTDESSATSAQAVVAFPAVGGTVAVELACTDEQRERGLMQRTALPSGTGMLFVFPTTVQSPFWMKDTPLSLSIAFIDAAGAIVDIQDMQPYDHTLHYPAQHYRYALEVPQGWFATQGITVGQSVTLPPAATTCSTAS